ncbi:MAG: signal transduction protein [Pseudomonadota bacterium]
MKNLKTLSLLLIATLLIGACASRDDRRPPRGGGERGGGQSGFEGYAAKPIALLFVGMDENQDRFVDGGELAAGIESEWNNLLSERAVGALDYSEWSFATLGSADALPSFVSFDRDLDGRLSVLEFEDRLRAEFVDLDSNLDGVLARSELIFRVTRPSREERGGQQGGQRGSGGQDGRRRPPQ